MLENLEEKNISKNNTEDSNNEVDYSSFDDFVEFYLEVDEEKVVTEKQIEDDKNNKEKKQNKKDIIINNITKTDKPSKPKPNKPKPVVDNTLYKSTKNDGKYKILVIDDDKWIVRLFKQYLNQWGFTTISAINPFQGLNEAIHHKPLAIFLDVLIPEVAGDTLLKFLKRGDVTTDIPVVLISANLNKTIIKSTYLSGASGFLTKPLSQDILYNKVCEILDEETYNKMISEGLLINKSSQQE